MEAPPANFPSTQVAAETRDTTGHSHLVFNILVTWAGQMVYFAAGFVMPRLIDRELGQEVLGVWDFCWTLTAYFRFVDMGITSSVSRFVGRHWAQQDIEGINRVVSSATVALVMAALVILLVTVGGVVALPYWFGGRLGDYAGVTQKAVLCLGVMLTSGTILGAFNGVLTGCHRWELQTMRNTGWYFISVVAMIIALWLGGGLVTLAAITAICNIFAHWTLVALAYGVCPGLQLRRRYVNWSTIKELYAYGGKTLMPTVSEMLVSQTTSVLVMGSLGPASLALFTRPRSLLRNMDTLERKMAMILVPTTSSLEVTGRSDQIPKLMIKAVRYSIYLVLPLVLMLVAFGGEILRVWMGPHYANWALPAVLAVGFLGTCIQTPIFSMLSGLNVHGRAGMGQFIGSILSVTAVFVALKLFHMGLTGAAVAVTVPLLVVNVFYLPVLLCKRLGQSLGKFYAHVAVRPIIHVLPFAIMLAAGRLLFRAYPIWAFALCGMGAMMLAAIYWQHVLPDRLKMTLRVRYERIFCLAR